MMEKETSYITYSHNFPQIQLHPSISKSQIQDHNEGIKFDSHLLTLVLYNYLETPQLEDFLDVTLEAEGELCLVKKQISTTKYKATKQEDLSYEYYLLYMVNENTPLELESYYQSKDRNQLSPEMKQLKPILTALISLCDKIMVFDLDNEKESFIEKIFFQSITTCQKIKWQNPYSRVQRLIFIRQCYDQQNVHKNKTKSQHTKPLNSKYDTSAAKITITTSMEALKYFSSLSEYNEYLNEQKQRYLNLNYQFAMVNDNHFMDNLIKGKNVVKKLSLKEILQIYQNIMKMMTRPIQQCVVQSFMNQFAERMSQSSSQHNINIQTKQTFGKINLNEPWKVRYYTEKMYELDSLKNLYSLVEREIFYPDTASYPAQFVHKEILKYLNSTPTMKLNEMLFNQSSLIHLQYIPQFLCQPTLSASSRQKLIWKLTRLQKFQRQLIQQSKFSPSGSSSKLIYELSDEQITFWLQKHKHQWLQISLSHLKQFFNKIANQKDHKAIQQFKQQCYKMQQRSNQIDTEYYEYEKQESVKYLREELRGFIEYHNDVLEQKRFAGLRFFWREIPYTLKHKHKIRNKMILFVLIVVLALMQKNVIAGLTIGTMAFIMLAIRL